VGRGARLQMLNMRGAGVDTHIPMGSVVSAVMAAPERMGRAVAKQHAADI
jgi:hypothetical protein